MKASGGVRESPRTPHFVPLGIRPASREGISYADEDFYEVREGSNPEPLHSARTVCALRVACALRVPHGDAGAGRGLDLAYVLDQLRVCVVHCHHHRNDPWGCRHGFQVGHEALQPLRGRQVRCACERPHQHGLLCHPLLSGGHARCLRPWRRAVRGLVLWLPPEHHPGVGCLLRGDLPTAGSHRELCAQGVQRPCSGDAADARGFDCPLWACA